MTEAARFARLLARRISASRQYGDDPVEAVEDGGSHTLTLPLLDAEVFLLVDAEEGRVKGVLAFLCRKAGRGESLHLNNWFRGDDDAPVPDLVRRAWAKLWEDEQENGELGRVLWMHGPDLPSLPEDVPVQEQFEWRSRPVPPPPVPAPNLVDELAAVAATVEPGPPPRPRKVPLVDASVLDLFGE